MAEQVTAPTEETLLAIWRALFKTDRIGPDDDFFLLGGHSLLAARMCEHVAARLGVKLEAAQVYQLPTVAELAALIDGQDSGSAPPASPYLLMLRPGESPYPLFCMHNIAGGVIDYTYLARNIGGPHPVYAIQGRGVLDDEPLLLTVSAMAAHCVREVRASQPQGPYRLIGASFAGLVAFEAARQLRAAGEEIALLVLLDTWLNYDPLLPAPLSALAQLYRRMRFVINRRLKRLRSSLRGRVSPDPAAFAQLPAPDYAGFDPRLARRYDIAARSWEAATSYRPAPLSVPTLYFLAQDRRGAPPIDQERAWGHLIPSGLRIQPMPGDHGLLLGPELAPLLARRLTRELDDLLPPARPVDA